MRQRLARAYQRDRFNWRLAGALTILILLVAIGKEGDHRFRNHSSHPTPVCSVEKGS